MDDRQVLLGNLWITTLGNSEVLIAALTEASIAAPIVSNDQRSRRRRCSRRTHRATRRYGRARRRAERVRHSVRLSGCRAWCPAFDDAPPMAQGNENLVVNTTALPHAFARQPRFRPTSTWFLGCPPILSWLGRTMPERSLWENLKGRLVARKTKLPLKLHGGHAGRLTGDQISGPEPDVQRSVATLHHCSHRQPGVLAAPCGQRRTPGRFSKWNGSPRRAAVRAGKAVSPAGFLQVGGAGRIIGEKSLELG